MAGRAGRRGIDKIGYVIHLNNFFELPNFSDYKTIL
jgi:superfamily II RNA helicase